MQLLQDILKKYYNILIKNINITGKYRKENESEDTDNYVHTSVIESVFGDAVQNSNFEVMNMLMFEDKCDLIDVKTIINDASKEFSIAEKNRMTPLYYASLMNDEDIVQWYLNKICNLSNIKNNIKITMNVLKGLAA